MGTKRSGIIEKNKAQGILNPSGPRLLTIKQASKHLGLTVWAVRERIWAGHIPVVRFPGGRKMYLDRSDIDNFIEKNKVVIT